MHALRRHYLCVLSLISVCMIIALAAPSPVSAQKLPLFQSTKEQTPAQGAVAQASLPATDEEIDRAVARIESRLAGLRQESAAAAEAKDDEKAGLLAAPPEELRKRQRLLSELLLTLDKYVQSLRELKEVRKTYSERSAEIKPGVEPSPKQFAGVVQLQSTVETEQALVAAETRPPGKSRKRTLR